MTASIRSNVGTLMTHSRLFSISPRLWFRSQMKHPTSDGLSFRIMCQPIVITSRSPPWAELTSTTGPGSRNRRIFSVGKSTFL